MPPRQAPVHTLALDGTVSGQQNARNPHSSAAAPADKRWTFLEPPMSLRSAPVPPCDVSLTLGLTPLSAASVCLGSEKERDAASASQNAVAAADLTHPLP